MLYLRTTLVTLFSLLATMPAEALTACEVDGKLIYTRECLQRQSAQVTDELHQHQLRAVSASHAPTRNAPAVHTAPSTPADVPASANLATPPITATSVTSASPAPNATVPAIQPSTSTIEITEAPAQQISPPSLTDTILPAIPTATFTAAQPERDRSQSARSTRLPPPPSTRVRAEDCAASRLFRAVEQDHLRLLQQCQSPQILQTLSNSAGRTLLHQAAAHGSLQSLEYLLAQQPKLESRARGDKGATPLHLAAAHNQVSGLQALVQAGANLEARDYLKRTPLHRANAERAMDSVAALIQLGADLDSVDRAQQTPLLVASQQLQSAPLLAQLIDAGATLNHTNYRDMTALHYSAVTDTASTRLLIERKIDLNRMDNDGRTAILLAASEGIDTHWERIKLLVEAGANLNLKDKTGNTLLKLAYNNQHEEFLKLLLRHGVDSRNVVRVIEKYNKQAIPE